MIESIEKAVWGRTLTLKVVPAYTEREDVPAVQELALEGILAAWDVVDASLDELREYCLANGVDEEGMPNVFRFVMPTEIYLDSVTNHRVVALMCEYRPDPEHGLAIVFEDERLREIGPQDIIL